jgi:ribosomal protein L4
VPKVNLGIKLRGVTNCVKFTERKSNKKLRISSRRNKKIRLIRFTVLRIHSIIPPREIIIIRMLRISFKVVQSIVERFQNLKDPSI